MFSVQFSKDGEVYWTLIKFDDRALAESVMAACAGYGAPFQHPFWRVRRANQESSDFHAVVSE